jgi:hypothetical protein
LGYRLNSCAHLLPAYRRLPGFLAIATSLSFRDVVSRDFTKIRAAGAIAPPNAPIGAAAAPLTASGNRCAQNWLPGFLPRQRFVAEYLRTSLEKENGLAQDIWCTTGRHFDILSSSYFISHPVDVRRFTLPGVFH